MVTPDCERDRFSRGVSRRRHLATVAGVATAGFAGCSSLRTDRGVSDSGATDVILSSAASEQRTVTVTITEADAETPRTDRTVDLSPAETVDPVNDGKLPTNTSSYSVSVSVVDGPSETFEWTEPTVELAPLWVRIDDTRNIVFLLQAG